MVATTSFIPPPPLAFDDSPASMTKRISKKRPLPRKVGFADASTFEVNLRFHHGEEERASTWYSSRDYATFGKDVKKTVKHIRKGHSFTGLHGRGLEKYFSSQYHEEKKRRELSHYRSILLEQQRQRSEGRANPKILRMLSTINSKWALLNALELAKHDHLEASKTEEDVPKPDNDSGSDLSSIEISLKDDELLHVSSL
jgi:hypothetical protein